MPSSALKSFMTKGDLELIIVTQEPAIHALASQPAEMINDEPPRKSLRCHSALLKLASPFLEDLLESCPVHTGKNVAPDTGTGDGGVPPSKLHHQQQGSGSLACLEVEGSSEAWLEILEHLYRYDADHDPSYDRLSTSA